MFHRATTETDNAANILRSLEHKLSESIDQNYQNRRWDVQRDLRKLIQVLENPVFKHNLSVQESIRNLKDHVNRSENCNQRKQKDVETRNLTEDREISHVQLTIPSDVTDPGWTLVDEGNSVLVADVVPDGFIARDGQITPGTELLVIDGQSVAASGLSSADVNELLRSRFGFIATCSSNSFGVRLPASSEQPNTADFSSTDFQKRVLDKNGDQEGTDRLLDLVVEKRRVDHHRLDNINLTSGTTFALTSWSARVGGCGENNMVLHGDWTQIQIVELENDGSGLGFGIVGGRSTGVVVKTILAGGAADKDGRLRTGDHLLQINDVHLHGMSSEQVAMILRQQDQSVVKIVIGRSADTTSPHPSHSSYHEQGNEGKQTDNRGSFVVPTKVASDPLLLDQHLQQLSERRLAQKEQALQQSRIAQPKVAGVECQSDAVQSSSTVLSKEELTLLSSSTFSKENRQPDEHELFDVTLKRDPATGLGIAVACYVHRKEEIAGLFIRNLLPGSVSDVDGRVKRHDQIVKVNKNDIDEVRSHKEAIRYLADAGDVVQLTLVRYHPSSIKYRFLEMLAAQDSEKEVVDLHSVGASAISVPTKATIQKRPANADVDYEEAAKKKWRPLLGMDQEIVVARIQRNVQADAAGGHHFGIALEGTVDVVNGTELRPHHYIRSVSPDSAAAACGRLCAGDELLEANGHELYGRSYLEVVDTLKQIASSDIQLVCARSKELLLPANRYEPSTSALDDEIGRTQPPSSLITDRLVKAKSEVSLLPSATAGTSVSYDSLATDRLPTEVATVFRSRSLEPLTNLAVWSAQAVPIELAKGDRGLGFSVLDYQDPLHPSDTVIVVRSLVPGGVAATDGRVVPGDRLVYINEVDLTSNTSLEKAVSALKNAPKGIVRLGIAKPMSLDEQVHSPIITQTERLLAKGSMSSPQPSRKWETERQTSRPTNVNGHRYQQEYRSADVYGDEILGPPPPLPRLPPPDWTLEARRRLYPERFSQYDREQQQRVQSHRRQHPQGVRQTVSTSAVYGCGPDVGNVTGRLPQSFTTSELYGGSYLSMSSWSGGSSPSLSPAASPSLLRGCWASDVIHLPSHLEQAIKIKKAATDPLGVTVEAVDKAINGCLVKSMLRSGAFGKDDRVQVGDFLVRMNNENLRNVTNSQARAILKRTNLLGATDFNVSYIPCVDADKYKDYVAKQNPPTDGSVPNVNRLSPKSPYVPRRQGAQSVGESDASSDVETSYRDGELPLSPGAFSQGGAPKAQPMDSDCLPRPSPFSQQQFQSYQDTSSASSVAPISTTTSSPIDYKHYPVSGDQFSPSYYEKRIESQPVPTPKLAASTSHEFRPRTFSETLPPVAEETKLSPENESETRLSLDKESEIIAAIQSLSPEKELQELEIEDRVGLEPTTETSGNDVNIQSTGTLHIEVRNHAAVQNRTPDSPTISATSSLTSRSKYWGEPRSVELAREPGRSLGISIVGGRVEVSKGAPGTGTTVSGIFIKSVIAQSPAGRCGQLNMGDRILSVNGVDLKEATHEQAVDVIRNAANPVRFTVQSLHSIPVQSSGSGPSSPFAKQSGSPKIADFSKEPQQHDQQLPLANDQRLVQPTGDDSNIFKFTAPFAEPQITEVQVNSPDRLEESDDLVGDQNAVPAVVEASVVVVEPRGDQFSVVSEERTATEDDDDVDKLERLDTFAADRPMGTGHAALSRRPSEPLKPQNSAYSADRRHSSFEHFPTGQNVKPVQYKKLGEGESGYRGRVDSESAAALRRADDDVETEDEFGYTEKKMRTKYGDLRGDLVMVEFEKRANGLGLSLAGHRDRSKLSVFVVGIQPESPAAVGNKVVVGDELLEINGVVLHGRSHLNASAIIKGVQDPKVKLIILRRADAIEDMAVNPIQYNPSMQRWLSYSGVSNPSARSPAPRTSVTETTANTSVSGMSPKANVTAALSVDLTYAPNDKRRESSEKTVPIDKPHGKTSAASPDQNFATPRHVKVHKGPFGFGITLTDGTTNDNIRGIFITHISPDSPSAQEKTLKIGDQVLAVNGRSVSDMTSTKVAEMIQDNNEVELTVNSHTIVPLPHSPATTAKRSSTLGPADQVHLQRKVSGSISPNLASNLIVAGHETQIEIEKAGKGLGLSIVGGTDTVLGSVVIHEVYPDGAAAKDGRLQPGDQLLEVNGQSLRDVAHETAITILRQTPSKVRLLIYRDPNLQLSLLDPTQIYNIFEVELVKKPGKGLGLSIVGRKTEPGVFISEVVKGGVADADGRLLQGDQILAVNGQDLTNAMQEQAATILKTCMGKVSLKVGRWKLTGNNPSPSFPVSKILAPSGAISPMVPAISVHQAKPTLVTIEEPPSRASPTSASPRPSPSPPFSSQQQPFDIHVSTTSGSGSLTNGDHCTSTIAVSPIGSSTPMDAGVPIRDGRSTPEPLMVKKDASSAELNPDSIVVAATVTARGPPSAIPYQRMSAEESKSSVPALELSEDGCDTIIVEMQKTDRPLGMGIGKRPRGILVTSIQPGTAAAEKLKVADRILAVNGQVVTDQQSAVNYVKSSGAKLVLQLARPRPECMDLATGHVRSSLTTIKEVTLQRGPEGGFGFSIDGGLEERQPVGSTKNDRLSRTPIFICSMTKNGSAALDGRIKVGDVVLAVNGHSLQNAAHADAVQLIKQSSPKVTLMLMANPKQKRRNS